MQKNDDDPKDRWNYQRGNTSHGYWKLRSSELFEKKKELLDRASNKAVEPTVKDTGRIRRGEARGTTLES